MNQTPADGFIYYHEPKIQYFWNPQEDITIYELALCLPLFQMGYDVYGAIERLPEGARRHFEESVTE